MKRRNFVLATAFGLPALSGCQFLGETREQQQMKVERAGDAREQVWVSFQNDRTAFSDSEWSTLEFAHNQALELAAQITVGFTTPGGLTPEIVQEWLVVGQSVYDEVDAVLTPERIAQLSSASRANWYVYRARLAGLGQSAKNYIANPNNTTYQAVASAGLSILAAVI